VAIITVAIASDIHYAGAAERARGDDYEIVCIRNPVLRTLVRLYRRFVWLKQPLQHNDLLDRFIEQARGADYVVANGDYSCNTACLGISDDAACQSAGECLAKLRAAFGERLGLNYGDHELGKVSFVGGRGGMRLASWRRTQKELGLEPFWQARLGRYVLMGVVSSLIALPVFEADTLAEERAEWERLRKEHLAAVRGAFAKLATEDRILLFCHDPSALPFLLREEAVQARLGQIEQTIIGHLHSNLIFWKSRWLAGIPQIRFLGHTAKRLSSALREARHWKPFNVRLCPALAGIELLKDGGFLTAHLETTGSESARFRFHPLPR
jgi:hypothetical protein